MRKNHKILSIQLEAGYTAHRYDPQTDHLIVLYDGKAAGLDTSEGRWAVYCVEHGEFAFETNQKRARKLMREPEKWCGGCQNEKTKREEAATPHTVPFKLKSPEDQEREMRFMAMKVQGNPEKAALFERVYGVKPDSYWTGSSTS